MAIDYEALGKRISNARKQIGITQETLGEQLNMTRKHISVIETAINRPSLDTLVDIANALNVSADDLLVDSLTHSASTADSEIHCGLDCCQHRRDSCLDRGPIRRESRLQSSQQRSHKGDDGVPDGSDLRLDRGQCCTDQDLDCLPDGLKQIFERIQQRLYGVVDAIPHRSDGRADGVHDRRDRSRDRRPHSCHRGMDRIQHRRNCCGNGRPDGAEGRLDTRKDGGEKSRHCCKYSRCHTLDSGNCV